MMRKRVNIYFSAYIFYEVSPLLITSLVCSIYWYKIWAILLHIKLYIDLYYIIQPYRDTDPYLHKKVQRCISR